MQRGTRWSAVAVAVALLAGCGGGKTAAPADPEVAAKVSAGCPDATAKSTEEMFVRALFTCNGQSLYVFNTSSARDSWSKIANEFGGVELKRGDTWLLVKAPDTSTDSDAQAIAQSGAKDCKIHPGIVMVKSEYDCAGGLTLDIFTSAAAREAMSKAAVNLGVVMVKHGDTWTLSRKH